MLIIFKLYFFHYSKLKYIILDRLDYIKENKIIRWTIDWCTIFNVMVIYGSI